MVHIKHVARHAIVLLACGALFFAHGSSDLVYIDELNELNISVNKAIGLSGENLQSELCRLQKKIGAGVKVFSVDRVRNLLAKMRKIFQNSKIEDSSYDYSECLEYVNALSNRLGAKSSLGAPSRSFTVTEDGVIMLGELWLHELGIDVQQTVGTDALNIGTVYAEEINIGVSDSDQVINIGTGSGTTNITIGSVGDTVTIPGGVVGEISTSTGKLLTLNKNGVAGSASNAGIELEEGASITGYFKTDGDRDSWVIKAPAVAGIIALIPGVTGFTIDQGSHDPVSLGTANGLSLIDQELSLATASDSTTGALSSADWSAFNNKQGASDALDAFAAYDTNGLITQTASNTFTGRMIVGTANQINVANGNGVAGNPTLSLPQDIATSSSPTFSNVTLTDQGQLHLVEATGNGSNYVAMQAPAALAADYTLTLPVDDGDADEVMIADGSGILSFGKITDANIDPATSIADIKLDTISTAGKVENSATTATSANAANAIVARDASGNFSAGTVTASLIGNVTGAASENVLKSGDTMTGNLVMDNQKQVRFAEATGNGSNYVAMQAPAALAADYTLTLPVDDGDADEVMITDGSGILSFGKITDANIDPATSIADTKLDTISTAGKIENSATTATSANAANAIVARDASGNFSAGTVTASLIGNVTGAASENVLKSGDTMTGNLVMDNQKQVRFAEATGNGSSYVAMQAPAALAADYTLTLPVDDGDADQVLKTDGNGNLTWTDNIGNGDILSGGNTLGSNIALGTNDAFALSLETNNVDRIQISNTGVVTVTNLASAGVVHTDGSGVLSTSLITNDDVASNAAIEDTKLDTISTAGKVENSATTATPNNTPNTIVERDGSGNFSAGIITASGLNLGAANAIQYRDVAIIADSATVSPETSVYIAVHSGLASVFTLTLPASGDLVNGKMLSISASGALLTLNLAAGSGTSLSPAINTGIGDQHYTLVYREADTTWYEI